MRFQDGGAIPTFRTCVFDPPTPADFKKKSLGEFFGKVVRKATPPVSTIEEDS
jgi:hypothetical protein